MGTSPVRKDPPGDGAAVWSRRRKERNDIALFISYLE
jgi:hypothetical protein